MSGEALTVLAYIAVWVILTVYLVLVVRRQSRLEGEIRALRTSLEGSQPPLPSPPPSPAARP
jgi:CcmD family protein